MADHPFDQVFWQERKHTDLLWLVITDDGVEKKPCNKAEPSFASTVTQHTPAALKLVESYRDRKKPFNIVFFLRKSRDSEAGSSSGFSIDRLKKIESAAPGEAEMLISANAWTVGRLPQGTETKKKGKSKDKALANPDRLGSIRPTGDYLAWYREQAADPNADGRALFEKLFEKLADCRVSTPEEARKIALRHKMPVLAQEGCSVSRLIRMARDVADFADKGDFVWIVQCKLLAGDVSDEIWISSTSGAVISVFKGNVEPGADSPDEKASQADSRLRSLSIAKLLEEYERSGLAIQDTYWLPSDEEISRALFRHEMPQQNKRVAAFQAVREEILGRGEAVVPELLTFLRRELTLRRKKDDDAVATPGFAVDSIELLVSLRDWRAAEMFVEILAGADGQATTYVQRHTLRAIEALTYCSFRRTKFNSNYGHAIETGDATADDKEFRRRVADLYRSWLRTEGKDPASWLPLARGRAREMLQRDNEQSIYCAAAFLRPYAKRDDQPEQTLARLAEVMAEFELTDPPYGYSWKGQPLSVSIGNWMTLLGNYGALARPHVNVMIRLQDQLGVENANGFARLGQIGGDRATAYLVKSLPLVKGSSLACCRNAIDQLASKTFYNDQQRIGWWKQNARQR